MPVIFVTVEESLRDLAGLKRGEHVLIHAAAGGVGLVAIQYAQWVGAVVYATAGAEEKHAYLRSLGVKYITSSRNGQKFEDDMKGFLQESGAKGIDVVLNSLSHDDYIPRSLALLKQGGRFIEIGKRGIWSHAQMREARSDVMYEKIAADTMMEMEPWRYNGYLRRLLERVEDGALRPIHMHTFRGFEEGVAAMQFLQRAQNIGKVVISEPSRMLCGPSSAPVLSGGTGALGVIAAQHLVEEGAKTVHLLSRSGKVPSDVKSRFDWLQAASVVVRVHKCDVSQEASVKALKGQLEGSLDCLLHLAGALADGMLPNLTGEMFQQSYGPKVHGLHHLRQHLPFEKDASFVLFSSTSSLFGSPGQGNYAAANSVLDAVAPHWTALGHGRARSVQWGPWGEAGMAVDKSTLQRAKASGLGALSSAQGMAIMGSVLLGADALVGAVNVRWPKFLRTVYDETPRFLEAMQAEARKAGAGAEEGPGAMADLAGMTPEQRAAAIQETIHRLAKEVVSSDDLSADAPLLESGMDSLSGVEFKNRLQADFGGIRIPNSAVFDYPTVAALSGFVAGYFEDQAPQPNGAHHAPEGVAAPAALLEQLNERTAGLPLFVVPGAGMQTAGLRALASMLPMPVHGACWPKDHMPRDQWPTSLSDLAALLLEAVRAARPSGPYLLAGHSFGATICVEMARQLEAAGEEVALAALLDPRTLTPISEASKATFGNATLADTLALLARSAASDGARYAEQLERLADVDAAEHAEILRRDLGAAAAGMLEHVHETSQWQALLIAEAEASDACLAARMTVLRAEETWLREATSPESRADQVARASQLAIFQRDDEVADRAARSCSKQEPGFVRVPGGHFALLQEPHVVSTALKLCQAVVEAGAADYA